MEDDGLISKKITAQLTPVLFPQTVFAMEFNNRQRLSALMALMCALIAATACNKQKPQQNIVQQEQHVALQPGERYDLARDETRGGHTLSRHIGKTDAELKARLESEPISTDSAYTDRATAEMAVAAAIRENRLRIDRWLHRPGGHSNLVLDYTSNVPVGRSLHRGETQSFPCSHAVAILKWVSPAEYYVLTSYPDCWRPK